MLPRHTKKHFYRIKISRDFLGLNRPSQYWHFLHTFTLTLTVIFNATLLHQMHIFTFWQLFWFVLCTSAVAIWSFQGRFCRRSEQSGGSSRSGLSWFSQWESRRRSMFTRRKKGERKKENFFSFLKKIIKALKLMSNYLFDCILQTEIFTDKLDRFLNQSRILRQYVVQSAIWCNLLNSYIFRK